MIFSFKKAAKFLLRILYSFLKPLGTPEKINANHQQVLDDSADNEELTIKPVSPSSPSRTEQLPVFENFGFCCCCNSVVKFVAYGTWWREQYICSQCGSIPRERAIIHCIEKYYPAWASAIVHESSPAARGASVRLKSDCPGYFSSQYFPEVKPGTYYQGNRCENLEALTFEDNSVDLHVTQDVLEHIFSPDKAFKEIARTLKPGGIHFFTTPLMNKDRPSVFTARLTKDGMVEHLIPVPEYHGNPVSNEGSLVTVHWGYDICDYIYRASGLTTEIVYIDALELGIRAEYIEVLVTRKPYNIEKE